MKTKKRMADGLLTGLKQAVQMESGRIKGRSQQVKLAKPAPNWSSSAIKKLRTQTFEMSQPIFAALINVKPATVRAWEQGQRKPDGATSRLLELLSKDVNLAAKIAS
jgi:DNA-binding transcriptional regulator YiaG